MLRVGRRLALCGAAAALLAAGCGLEDSALVECRCAEDTDVDAFPHCRNAAAADSGEPDPSNPFSTRVPDCPSGKLLFLREPATPVAVLLNVRDTFEGFSSVQYLDQLSEDFLYAPDLDGVHLYPEVFRAPEGYDPDADADTLWALEQERRFAGNLLDRTRFRRIEVTRWYSASQDEQILYPDDRLRETYIFNYAVELTEQPRADGTALIVEARGRMRVDLATASAENPVWSVRRWQDYRDPASARRSLTDLRGEFSQ